MKGLAHPGGFLNGCGGPLNAVTMKNKGSLVRGTPLICLRQVRYNDGRKEVAYIDESSQHYFKRKLSFEIERPRPKSASLGLPCESIKIFDGLMSL